MAQRFELIMFNIAHAGSLRARKRAADRAQVRLQADDALLHYATEFSAGYRGGFHEVHDGDALTGMRVMSLLVMHAKDYPLPANPSDADLQARLAEMAEYRSYFGPWAE
jgi:hypothetical protein